MKMANTNWDWLEQQLQDWQSQERMRSIVNTEPLGKGYVMRDGRRLLNVASNDYLGFAEQAEVDTSLPWGAGASRLVTGSHPVAADFEQQFASYKGTERVLLFNSGYAANVGVIAALAGRGDLIYCDRLNHASIIDGAILSRAEIIRYRHRDMNELEHLLRQAAPTKRKWIISDTIFSMDGTIAPLSDLVTLKEKYGAYLMIDEAHSGGVFGESGRGLAHHMVVADRIDLHMGTFSKAYGRLGAYLACAEPVYHFLINKARSFVYSTAMPAVLINSIWQVWLQLQTDSWRRQHVLSLAARFRQGLTGMGLNIAGSESQIVPLIVGSDAVANSVQAYLQEEGVLAVAIRPPTVPEGSARIRFSWTAHHSEQDVDHLLALIDQMAKKVDISRE
jgi:8-amino-7-oxononanoate synthase